jgi:hypothetical protein
MQTMTLTVTIDVDGAAAADVVDDLGIDVEAGALDQALLNLVRDHLRRVGDTRDYRIVRCAATVQEGGVQS